MLSHTFWQADWHWAICIDATDMQPNIEILNASSLTAGEDSMGLDTT
jgi:hypothetical protein